MTKPLVSSGQNGVLLRKSACGHVAMGGECTQCDGSSQLLRHSTSHSPESEGHSRGVPPIVHDVLHSPGQPLDAATRAFFEPRFSQDFSKVRVHTDAKAAESARAVNALAYSVGQDIFFNVNQHTPEASRGRSLIAHELTHVVQQGNMDISRPPKLHIENDVALENEASLAADRVLAEQATPKVQKFAVGALQRQKAKPEEEKKKQPPALKQFAGITTPLEEPLTPMLGGEVGFDINETQVEVLPDTTTDDEKMSKRAETTFNISGFNVDYTTQNGKVDSFTGPETPKVTIQTVYGPGAAPEQVSGYGKGTTGEEQKTGKTTLGYHEGEHGRDYLQFLRENPFPMFKGSMGMKEKEFNKAIEAYKMKRAEYHKRMKKFSADRTDCVGKTIDQFNAEEGSKTAICKKKK